MTNLISQDLIARHILAVSAKLSGNNDDLAHFYTDQPEAVKQEAVLCQTHSACPSGYCHPFNCSCITKPDDIKAGLLNNRVAMGEESCMDDEYFLKQQKKEPVVVVDFSPPPKRGLLDPFAKTPSLLDLINRDNQNNQLSRGDVSQCKELFKNNRLQDAKSAHRYVSEMRSGLQSDYNTLRRLAVQLYNLLIGDFDKLKGQDFMNQVMGKDFMSQMRYLNSINYTYRDEDKQQEYLELKRKIRDLVEVVIPPKIVSIDTASRMIEECLKLKESVFDTSNSADQKAPDSLQAIIARKMPMVVSQQSSDQDSDEWA